MDSSIKHLEPFFGSWHMVELIGEGSFGKVYKIKRETFGEAQLSALKVIRIPQNDAELKQAYNEGLDDISVTSYFESIVKNVASEINMMVRFKGNTNIVSYEDHQIIPNENGIGATILIRMELLKSLNDLINSASLAPKDIIRLGVDICKALEKCHANHVIHRDIKPENIFVNEDGDFKLGDFGIARQLEKTMSGLSKKGTYTYMAPEVYLGKAYNSTVDLYSLGIVMYRLLNNNRTPFLPAYPAPISFNEKSDAQNKRMAGEAIPAPVNADSRLAQIVLKACVFNPADRFESPVQMREALINLNALEDNAAPPVNAAATGERTVSAFAEPAGPVAKAEVVTNVSGTTGEFVNNDKTESIFGSTQGLAGSGMTVSPLNKAVSNTVQSENSMSTVDSTSEAQANEQHLKPSVSVEKNQTPLYNKDNSSQAPVGKSKNKTWIIIAAAAAFLFVTIIGATPPTYNQTTQTTAYKTTQSTPATTQSTNTSLAQIANTNIGGIVYFGKYEQDNNLSNGKEPIAWRVLSQGTYNAFLLSEKILDCKPYNVEYKDVTWEKCTLRTWLNDEFYNAAFSSMEKLRIITSNVVNYDNSDYGTDGGNNTSDKLFLLSYSEVTNHAYGFSLGTGSDSARVAQGTDYAKSQELYIDGENSVWWLRTPGGYPYIAGIVYFDGYVNHTSVNDTVIGVRPALWLSLSS